MKRRCQRHSAESSLGVLRKSLAQSLPMLKLSGSRPSSQQGKKGRKSCGFRISAIAKLVAAGAGYLSKLKRGRVNIA